MIMYLLGNEGSKEKGRRVRMLAGGAVRSTNLSKFIGFGILCDFNTTYEITENTILENNNNNERSQNMSS